MITWLVAALALAGEPVRLDLGGTASPVLDGFARTTPWASDDARVSWGEPPGRVREGHWPDALLGDTVEGGTLVIDLPPGRYAIGALFQDADLGRKPRPDREVGLETSSGRVATMTTPGDESFFESRYFAANPRPVFVRGELPWDRQIAPQDQWHIDEVVVGPDGLRVSPFGAPLAALVVTPADLATAEVELALVDARRRRFYETYHPSLPPQDAAFATRGLTGLEVLEWSGMPGSGTTTPDPILVAPGERRSILLAVHGSDAPATAMVEGMDGLGVRLSEVDWLDTQDLRLLQPRPHVLRPTDGEITASQGLMPLFAIELEVPTDASPGARAGRVRVARDGAMVELALPLEVLDLELVPAPVPLGLWADLRAPLASFWGPDSPQAQEVWEKDVALMRRYDVDFLSLRGVYFPKGWPAPGREVPEERLQRAVSAWRDAGGGPVMWVDPGFLHGPRVDQDPLADAAPLDLLQASREMVEAAKRAGVEVYLLDEFGGKNGPGSHDAYERFLAAVDHVNQPLDVPLGIAEPYPGAWPHVVDHVDVIYLQFFPQIDPAQPRWFDGRRAVPRSYTAFYTREAAGRIPWLLDTETLTVWHYNDDSGDPYADVSPRTFWSLSVLTPGGNEPLATRRLELLREGVTDQRYLGTLSSLITALEHKKRPRVREGIEHGCLLLRAAASGLVGRLPRDNTRSGLSDDRSLADLRTEVARTAAYLSRWADQVDPSATAWPVACGEPLALPDGWRQPPDLP